MKELKSYAIFDGRYLIDPDRAICCVVCETLEEAQENQYEYGDDAVLVEWTYEIEPDGTRLITDSKTIS